MNLRCNLVSPSVLLASTLCLTAAVAAPAPAPAPVAYVYVVSAPGSSSTHLYAFAASSAGKLTAISGSPYSAVGYDFALTGKWVFSVIVAPSHTNLVTNSYSIATNGSLKHILTGTVPVTDGFDELEQILLDHTGASLYAKLYASDQHAIQTLKVNSTTGKLTAGTIAEGADTQSNVTVLANNQFLYGTNCDRLNFSVAGLMRMSSDGSLSILGGNAPMPGGPMPADVYGVCPGAVAADASGHVVIGMQAHGVNDDQLQSQLAVYTADKFGKLTTKSTFKNMPVTKSEIDTLAMSPTGTYLAESGPTGIHLYLMHGADPITSLGSTLLPGSSYDMAWDKHQHLYALSYATSKLYVFNVTSTGATQVAGSPYTVPSGSELRVLSK